MAIVNQCVVLMNKEEIAEWVMRGMQIYMHWLWSPTRSISRDVRLCTEARIRICGPLCGWYALTTFSSYLLSSAGLMHKC